MTKADDGADIHPALAAPGPPMVQSAEVRRDAAHEQVMLRRYAVGEAAEAVRGAVETVNTTEDAVAWLASRVETSVTKLSEWYSSST